MTLARLSTAAVAVVACSFLFPSSAPLSANDDDHDRRGFSAKLESFNEVPAISSTARGSFRATLSEDGMTLHYKESYSGLSTHVLQSHIHFGRGTPRAR